MLMGRLLFFYILACLLLPAIAVNGQANQKDAYFAYNASESRNGPKFMDGIFMDEHQRKVIFRNVVEVKKAPENTTHQAVSSVADTKRTDINNIIKLASVIKAPENITDNSDTAEAEPVHDIAKKADAADSDPIPVGEIKIEHPEIKKVIPAIPKSDKPVERPEIKKTRTITDFTTTEPTKAVDEIVVDMPEETVDPLIQKYAEMINLEPSEIDNYLLYRFIDKWYGTQYKWGGTDKYGIDCSSFTQKLYSAVFNTDILRTSKQQHQNCEKIKHSEDASQGDLIFFRIHRWRVSHVGVYLANGFFAHASRSQGVVISNLESKYWHRRFAFCGKVERHEAGASESGDVE
jgi:hypothetical protein